MSRVGRVARVGALVVVAAGVAVGAARVPGTVELAPARGQAGLPRVSNVLVDEATIVCPGQQRLGAAGLRNVSGDVRVGASPAPADTLRAAGVAPPPGAGQVDLESGASGAVMATGATIDGLVAAPVTSTPPVVARATGALAPGLLATQVWRHTGDDDRGLVVTPCGLPAADAWLVGGGAGPSRTERLVVSNPGANAVTVAFDVFGRRGPIASAEGRSLSIPPRERVVLPAPRQPVDRGGGARPGDRADRPGPEPAGRAACGPSPTRGDGGRGPDPRARRIRPAAQL